jgi:hypothetical protein
MHHNISLVYYISVNFALQIEADTDYHIMADLQSYLTNINTIASRR